MTDRPRLIVAAPIHWTSVFQVGTHHIARAFSRRGWDVAYLSDPVSPFHLAAMGRVEGRQRLRLYIGGGVRDEHDGVLAYTPGTLLSPRGPHIPGSDAVASRWPAYTLPPVKRVLERHGFSSVDLIWIDSVIWEPLLDLVPTRRSVLRIADRASGFARQRRTFDELEMRLAKRSDLTVYTATTLLDHVRSLEPKQALHMPNGVDLARFEAAESEPPEYAGIPMPRAVYLGAMADWFDYPMVDLFTELLPDVSFVLIGPDEVARRRLAPRPNLHLLGRTPPARVPALLKHAQVGLIPFDAAGHADLVASIHPLKLYEYLASGLSVVAAEWPELLALDSPARTYSTADEAIAQIRAALADPRADSTAWLAGKDWRERVGAVTSALGIDDSAAGAPRGTDQ